MPLLTIALMRLQHKSERELMLKEETVVVEVDNKSSKVAVVAANSSKLVMEVMMKLSSLVKIISRD